LAIECFLEEKTNGENVQKKPRDIIGASTPEILLMTQDFFELYNDIVVSAGVK